MKIYVMTDSHLGHDKLITMGQGRPEDFTQQILDGVLKLPKEIDLLIHLGDVCIGNDEQHHIDLLTRIRSRAKKAILVRGNHDNKSDAWYYKQGWDFVCEQFSNTYFGKKIVFSHAPKLYEEYEEAELYDHNIHGHLHGSNHRVVGQVAKLYNLDWNIDVAPDRFGYEPIKLEKLWS